MRFPFAPHSYESTVAPRAFTEFASFETAPFRRRRTAVKPATRGTAF
jgi:hypothetical protein